MVLGTSGLGLSVDGQLVRGGHGEEKGWVRGPQKGLAGGRLGQRASALLRLVLPLTPRRAGLARSHGLRRRGSLLGGCWVADPSLGPPFSSGGPPRSCPLGCSLEAEGAPAPSNVAPPPPSSGEHLLGVPRHTLFFFFRFPGEGLNWSCSHWPVAQPQQHQIPAASVACTPAHSKTGSLTH